MMTREQTAAHERYERAPEPVKDTIDEAWYAVLEVFRRRGLAAATDDRAENLVAALMVYAEASDDGLVQEAS